MSGIISVCNVKLGERVVGTAQMAGTELIRIADLNNIEAQVDVNENDVLHVKMGDTADIEVDAYLNQKFKGIVTQIAYSSSSATSVVSTSQATNFTVKIKLLADSYSSLSSKQNGFPFRPGMSTTVDIHTETKYNVLAVPIQSVTKKDPEDLEEDSKKSSTAKTNQNFDEVTKKELVLLVWKYNATTKKVEAAKVTTGVQDANYIEILSGLKKDEEVVSAPFKMISKTLKNNDLVEVVAEKDLFEETESK
jgi:HlyD family secretion protein